MTFQYNGDKCLLSSIKINIYLFRISKFCQNVESCNVMSYYFHGRERSRNTAVEMSKEAKIRLDSEFTEGNKRCEKVMNSDRPIYLCYSSILF